MNDAPAAALPADIPDGAPADGAGGNNSGDDGGKDAATCGIFADDFASPPNGWLALGEAKLAGGEATLVPAQAMKKGAIWRPLLPTRTALQATFRFRILPTDNASDGLAFAWVDANAPPPLGGDAQNMGICGALDGFAFMVNSRDHEYLVRDLKNGCGGNPVKRNGAPSVTGEHVVSLTLDGTKLSADVDGVRQLETELPRPTTIRWLGFGGGTGGQSAKHVVDDVSFSACP